MRHMNVERMVRMLTLLISCVAAGPTIAQDSPAEDDAMTNESVESRINELGRRAAEPIEVTPADGRGMSIDDLRPPGARLVREGAFLTKRRGRLAQLSTGHWVYLFDKDATGGSEPPMIVSAGLRLSEMIRVTEARAGTVTFITSGEVFVYRNRNYFLIESFATVAVPVEHTAEEISEREVADQDAIAALMRGINVDADDTEQDPSVRSLLEPFDTKRAERESRGAAGMGSSDQPANLRREGSMLVLQRGHLRRNREGRWAFVIDNDADAEPTKGDIPMTLQPSLLLEELEDLVRVHGEQLALRVSGRLFVYEGENYLLPTMFLVDYDPSGNLTPGQ